MDSCGVVRFWAPYTTMWEMSVSDFYGESLENCKMEISADLTIHEGQRKLD